MINPASDFEHQLGTAFTVNFLLDYDGSTAQVLLDGNVVQEENTLNPTSFYYNCNLSPVASTNLPNQLHNLTVVKDIATDYMYLHSIVFSSTPITSNSLSISSVSSSIGSMSTLVSTSGSLTTPLAPSTTSSIVLSISTSTAMDTETPLSTSGSLIASSGHHSSRAPTIGSTIAALALLLIMAH
ncbi:hypothetical protein FRB94_008918 [Tulasnella sp. JGI-2019a]|nr:hypothetical protein FRB93_008188 [Tulasnella sp. JGI-2019a]KAG8995552.1 hypothetical protein FRB94_008918 [Tulasnella sp. JGI-2019a]KAG9028004.1 hypothetical protein FRB95_007010 [Tulasnella sp. JGI-2019a]